MRPEPVTEPRRPPADAAETTPAATPRARGRVFPRGVLAFLFQLSLYLVVYVLYTVVRGAADDASVREAFGNARTVIDWERSLGMYNELRLQRWTISHEAARDVANSVYFYAHFSVTTAFLFWLYFRRNDHYYFIRNMVFVAMAVALLGYHLFPTAPPRMLGGLGFVDTLEVYGSVNHDDPAIATISNQYAAMPSLHTCYGLIVGLTLTALAWPRFVRPLWPLYPAAIVFSIVATANHFWLDAVAGAALAVFSFGVAWLLERRRATLPASARARLRLPPAPRDREAARPPGEAVPPALR